MSDYDVIGMAWADRISFEEIKKKTGLNEKEVIKHITMGRNVPSTILSDIVTNALNENKHISHGAAVVYGYPNTIQQQMAFSRNLEDNMFGSALFIDQLVVGGANNKQLMSQNVDNMMYEVGFKISPIIGIM